MYIDTIKSRVQAFFRYLDISQKEFNASIGVKAGFINTDSEPTGQILSQIIRAYPQLSPDWLLTGSGTMLRSLKDHPNVTAITATDLITIDDAIDLDTPKVAEPTQPYKSAKKPETSLSDLLIESLQAHIADLQKQLENKDAQIATLLMKIPES